MRCEDEEHSRPGVRRPAGEGGCYASAKAGEASEFCMGEATSSVTMIGR